MSTKIEKRAHVRLSERQLSDLELITNGGFAPLKGFLGKEDYESVVHKHRLEDGTLWPIPIVLDVDSVELKKSGYEIGDALILEDTNGDKLAILHIESIFVPNKNAEALHVYGTTDPAHPGVSYLFKKTKDTYVGGKITPLKNREPKDFVQLRKTPVELKKELSEKSEGGKINKVVAFQTRNPIHRAHYELITRAATKHDAHILIHPAVGPTKDGDIDYATRVRSYEALVKKYIPEATLSLLPIAMRMAGPREALWHAIIRKNYGATHFIVGRDHAGPGKDSSGKDFYGPYDAQKFAEKFSKEIGITIIPSEELVYDENTSTYIYPSEVTSQSKITSISGTEFRKRLRNNEHIPEWFSFPEVIEVLRSKN